MAECVISKYQNRRGGETIKSEAFNSFHMPGTSVIQSNAIGNTRDQTYAAIVNYSKHLTFKSRLDKYLSCITDEPLVNGHCGDNSLLQRVADPRSDWRMWQKHENAAVTAQVERVTAAVGQVAVTL